MSTPYLTLSLMVMALLFRYVGSREKRKGCTSPPILAPLHYSLACSCQTFFSNESAIAGTFKGEKEKDVLYQHVTLGGLTVSSKQEKMSFLTDDGSEFQIDNDFFIVANPRVKGLLPASVADLLRLIVNVLVCFFTDDGFETRHLLSKYMWGKEQSLLPIDDQNTNNTRFNQLLLVERTVKAGERGLLSLKGPYPAVGALDGDNLPKVRNGGLYYFGQLLENLAIGLFSLSLISLFL